MAAPEENTENKLGSISQKNQLTFKFETDDKDKLLDVDPPLLYRKPSDYDIKKLVKIYLEQKNLI